MHLDLYQLAESVIAVVGQRRIDSKHVKSKWKETSNEELEYLLDFDKTTGFKSLWLDYESLKKLSEMRQMLLPELSPDWTAQPARSQSTREVTS